MPTKKPAVKAAAASSTRAAPGKKADAGLKAAPAKRSVPRSATSLQRKAATAAVVTLRHLAAELAEHHDLANKQADELMKHVVEMLVQHLKAGDRLRIGGLGILEVKHRPARKGRNPATGEAIQIKASRKIAFRPAKDLKEAI